MKTQFFAFTFSILASSLQAQLNLDHFSPGPVKRAFGVSAEIPSNSTGGQNQTWDFSNLNPTGEQFDVQYITPDATILNAFPTANLAMKVSDDTSQSYLVLNKSASGLNQIGLMSFVNGENSQIVFSNSKKIIPGTFAFGNQVSDAYKSLLDMSGSGIVFKIINEGNVSHEVDGNGTITLPDGSVHSNATRIKSYDKSIDTVILEIPGFPAEPDITENRSWQYNWFKNDGSGNPLLFSLSVDSTFSQGTWSTNVFAYFFESNTTSTGDLVKNQDVLPYPSLVEDYLTIPLSDKEKIADKITLVDGLGKVVFATEVKTEDFLAKKVELNLTHLPKGIYHIVQPGKMREKKKPISIVKL